MIREEQTIDETAVFTVHDSAFETDAEAKLVNALRKEASPIISLVAIIEDQIHGHILFSPVLLSGHPELKIMGLAPLAVSPPHQNKAIGKALTREGIRRCKEDGFDAIVVLGHPKYYPKFGFESATNFGIDSEYKVPEGVFMIMELRPDALFQKNGRIKYHQLFNEV